MAAPDLPTPVDELDQLLRDLATMRRNFLADIVGADAVRCRYLQGAFDKAIAPLLAREKELRWIAAGRVTK